MNPQTPNYVVPKQSSKLPLIIVSLMLILSLVFGIWAYGQMQDYKKNSDQKSAAAVAAAKSAQAKELQAQYDQQAKAPYKTYKGSATYGSISFDYPKTWSVYEASSAGASSSDEPINTYFYQDIVPSTNSNSAYPLRVELVNTDYADVVQQFSEQVSAGNVKASAYVPPKLKATANVQPGTRFDGNIGLSSDNPLNGSMVVLKVRDKTLEIYTQTNTSLSDFNDVVLNSLTFAP